MSENDWVMVPRVPDEAMRTAHAMYGDTSDWWDAVLAAAPQPKEARPSPEGVGGAWEQAVVYACMRVDSCFVKDDPSATMRNLEQWWYQLGVETTANGMLVEQVNSTPQEQDSREGYDDGSGRFRDWSKPPPAAHVDDNGEAAFNDWVDSVKADFAELDMYESAFRAGRRSVHVEGGARVDAAMMDRVLRSIRTAADIGGATEGDCYGWWRDLTAALAPPADGEGRV